MIFKVKGQGHRVKFLGKGISHALRCRCLRLWFDKTKARIHDLLHLNHYTTDVVPEGKIEFEVFDFISYNVKKQQDS